MIFKGMFLSETMSTLIYWNDVCETRGFFPEGSFCGYEHVQIVRGELLIVLLNGFESPFHSVPSCISYLSCGCSLMNALSSHVTPHLYGQFGVTHKLV